MDPMMIKNVLVASGRLVGKVSGIEIKLTLPMVAIIER
jgi:hypothetical protein